LNYAYADIYTFELPAGHRFPIEKYRLCRERLIAEGTVEAGQLVVPELCPREVLEGVHHPDYVDRTFEGRLSRIEIRRLGFPWSETLVRRSLCSVAGTIQAAEYALREGAGGNFAGGTHHAYPDHGEGFCVFNDIAVAARHLQMRGLVERVAVVDCDVHQGNGTAFIFREDSRVFTLSLHGKNNYPFEKEQSTLDVELEDGVGDEEYLDHLEDALEEVFRFHPQIVFYLAGVDTLKNDRFGKLSMTLDGLKERDRLVLSEARKRDLPVAIAFGGGYAELLEDVVEAHANTYRIAESLFPG